MRPGGKQGSARSKAQSAREQAQQAQEEAKRLQREAQQSARNALAAAREQAAANGTGEAPVRSDNWNKLASRLQKDLLQGRDNTPPEQYRTAIENYFRIISEKGRELENK
jgi:flagellar biosynthesis/type III secretory pathway protein FliH